MSDSQAAQKAVRAVTCHGLDESTNSIWGGGWAVAVKVGPLVLLGVKALYVAARAGTCRCQGGSTGPAWGGGPEWGC
jgi:hypothetical protein